MTREEIKNKLFDIILKNSSPTMVVKRTIDYQQTMVIVEELINHESNLLKEFVEWLKGVYAKDYDDKGKIADKSIGRGDKENFWYMEGQQTALQRIIDLLNQDLEKFLEEVKNETSN